MHVNKSIAIDIATFDFLKRPTTTPPPPPPPNTPRPTTHILLNLFICHRYKARIMNVHIEERWTIYPELTGRRRVEVGHSLHRLPNYRVPNYRVDPAIRPPPASGCACAHSICAARVASTQTPSRGRQEDVWRESSRRCPQTAFRRQSKHDWNRTFKMITIGGGGGGGVG